ncbi:MAG: hypothetical protein FWG44_00630 [Oscillospiraceae bacterium]|nr:hypothetical protein [Oscillospiraceae bacterium]
MNRRRKKRIKLSLAKRNQPLKKRLASFISNNYKKTTMHEIGHVMGWDGHPSSGNTTWVMQQGKLENTTLTTGEKNHLSQVY